jgi:hypothetical protein
MRTIATIGMVGLPALPLHQPKFFAPASLETVDLYPRYFNGRSRSMSVQWVADVTSEPESGQLGAMPTLPSDHKPKFDDVL